MFNICEFSGVSGCGKSTLINELTKSSSILIIIDSQVVIGKLFGPSVLPLIRYIPRKLISFLLRIHRLTYGRKYAREAKRLAGQLLQKNYLDCSLDTKNRLLRLVELIDTLTWWERVMTQNVESDIIKPWLVVDEGLVQRMAALGVDGLQFKQQFKHVSRVFDVQAADDTVIQRISERFRKTARIAKRHEMMSIDEILEDQKRFRRQLDHLFNLHSELHQRRTTIFSIEKVSTNVDLILRSIKECELR
jgi:hypothetical protein